MSAIEIAGLVVVRGGNLVLDHVSLSVGPGRITGLLGPSGSGKTTLMRAIVGVQRIAGGEVRVLGQPGGSASVRSRVGYVTQSPAVYADLTVTENLHYFRRVLGAPEGRVAEALETVELTDYAGRLVRTLSGGQRARVSLATALLNRPDLLVLDEPTVGLDPVLRNALWSSFRELAAAGTTLLVSSHVMDEAERCDDLVLMREGSILATGTVDDLLAQTGADDIERAFLHLVEQPAEALA